MARYQPTVEDREKPAKGDVPPDEDYDLEHLEADESDSEDIALLGRALISAILEYAPMEDVQRLLDEEAPLWYQDEDGWSALHAAASVEDAELVKNLLRRGAVWNSGDAHFFSPRRARELELHHH